MGQEIRPKFLYSRLSSSKVIELHRCSNLKELSRYIITEFDDIHHSYLKSEVLIGNVMSQDKLLKFLNSRHSSSNLKELDEEHHISLHDKGLSSKGKERRLKDKNSYLRNCCGLNG